MQVGYRVQDAQFQLSADAYFTKFSNRLLTTSPCTAVQTCAAILSNVGAVHSAGADLALMWRPLEGLSWLNSLSWNRSRYRDDYLNNGVVATSGKDVVGIPALMFSSSASYQLGNLRLDLDGKYVDKRYITFLNDSQVPSYWLFNAGARYDFGRVSGWPTWRWRSTSPTSPTSAISPAPAPTATSPPIRMATTRPWWSAHRGRPS